MVTRQRYEACPGAGTVTHRKGIADNARIDAADIRLKNDPSKHIYAKMPQLPHRERGEAGGVCEDIHDAKPDEAGSSRVADRFEDSYGARIDVRRAMNMAVDCSAQQIREWEVSLSHIGFLAHETPTYSFSDGSGDVI